MLCSSGKLIEHWDSEIFFPLKNPKPLARASDNPLAGDTLSFQNLYDTSDCIAGFLIEGPCKGLFRETTEHYPNSSWACSEKQL